MIGDSIHRLFIYFKHNKFLILRKLFGLILLSLPIVIMVIINYFKLPASIDEAQKVAVIIPRGATIQTIADTLFQKQLIKDKELFILWLTTLDKDRSLKAGYFEIPKNLNYAQLISFLSIARSKEIRITMIEGWRYEEIAEEMGRRLQIEPTIFVKLCKDSAFIASKEIKATSLEGYLLPDTYNFYWGLNEIQIIDYLVEKCMSLFTEDVLQRLDSLNMTIHEIITLASIIEGEVIFDDERNVVASVYHNRLKRRIKLQADPTIQYILSGPPRRLLYRDLEIDSPYNTYKYYGLPPGPINNPGKKSILAAIYPAKTEFLYFVARGDGRHTFTRSAAAHAREKAKFNKIRRELYRKRKLNQKSD